MVKDNRQVNEKTRANQGAGAVMLEAYKIGAATPFDFQGKNLTVWRFATDRHHAGETRVPATGGRNTHR